MPQPDDSKTTQLNKGKSPAFQFYPKDFLTDDKVIEMSAEVRGYYVDLLCIDWLNDGFYSSAILKLCHFEWYRYDGTLRDDSKDVEAQLLACFGPHPTKEGFVTNSRLRKERLGQIERSQERAVSGKKGAKKRWDSHTQEDSSAIKEPIAKNASSSPTSSTSTSPIKDKKGALSSADFVFHESLNNEICRKAVDELIQHRKQKGVKTTALSIQKLLDRYQSRAKELVENINHSIEKGWTGVFPDKTGPPARMTNYDRNKEQILKSYQEAKAREVR